MTPYLITGPESLLKAAFSEFELAKVPSTTPNVGQHDFKCLYVFAHGFWLDVNIMEHGETTLTLPADWDKLMGILADLKKPKLPQYVKAGTLGIVYKAYDTEARADNLGHNLKAYNVYGKECLVPPIAMNHCAPITEQEFIEGGLKELADAGYVKGAKFQWGLNIPFDVASVSFQKNGVTSESVVEEIKNKGFCFTISGGNFTLPVGKTTLIPALPTTSQGIPYTVNGPHVYLGADAKETTLQVGMLRYLLKGGVTGLDTRAGRLTCADLELLAK